MNTPGGGSSHAVDLKRQRDGVIAHAPVPTEPILEFPVAALRVAHLEPLMDAWIRSSTGTRCVACANPHSLMVAERDPVFADALRSCDLLIPDGAGVVLASRLRRGSIRERVTGMDAFLACCHALQESAGRIFFLGSTEETLARIRSRMAEEFPRVTVAGTLSPPFIPEFDARQSQEMVARVNEAAPHVLCVGMTAPKQEKWLLAHREELRVPVALAIGAVFDFFAGTRKRPGPTFQRLGLEWLPRLLGEPGRLWERTLVSAPRFMWRIAREPRVRSR